MIKFSELNELSKATLAKAAEAAKAKNKMATEFADSSRESGHADDAEWHQSKADKFAKIEKKVTNRLQKEAVMNHSHILDADIRVNKDGEYSNHRNTAKRGTILQALHNDHYEIKAGPHKGKIVKLSKETVVKADLGESTELDEISKETKQSYLDKAPKVALQQFLGRTEKPATKEKMNSRRAAIQKVSKELTGKTHFRESEQEEQMNEEMKKTEPKKSTPQFQKALTKARGLSTAGKGKSTPAFSDWLRKSRDESVEQVEENVFDWKKNKSEVDWKSDDKATSNDGKHKGTYGSEEHKAKGDGSVAPKKSVGRPSGSYQGEYKKRDAAGKAASLAKSMASKAEGLAVRKEFKGSMDAAIKKRQLQLAGITK